MRKSDFDHVFAAAAAITGENEIVVIGIQAILGSVAEPLGPLSPSASSRTT